MTGLQGISPSWPLLRHEQAAPVLEAEKAQAVLLRGDLGTSSTTAGKQAVGTCCNSGAVSACRTDVARLYLGLGQLRHTPCRRAISCWPLLDG